ncbi:sensor histidine kinase [Corallococcus sp. CA053C]|uniref:sensor histidine kinase n=1 Tax=Corallococcus sp. CA053C TaxID=2316732 RepID=UPI0011C3841D|nr:histidine kinase [Corallococcus sp. CA053C]
MHPGTPLRLSPPPGALEPSGPLAPPAATDDASSPRLPSERLLRFAGVVAWTLTVLEEAVEAAARPGDGSHLVARFAPLALYLPALWWLLGPGLISPRRRVRTALLVLLSLIGTFLFPNLHYIVAATLPFLLEPRRALRWLAACNVLGVPWLVYVLIRDPGAAGMPAWIPGGGVLLATLGAHLGWQAFAFVIGLIAATERRQRHESQWLNRELVATQGLLADGVRLADRVELSRELHDTLGHHLTVLHLQLERAVQLSDGATRSAVEEARGIGKQLLGEVRRAVGHLRTAAVIDLRTALLTLAHGTGAPRVHVAFDERLQVRHAGQAHALFRCAQEALTNALRHAGAGNVWLEVREEEATLVLSAHDDGQGQRVVQEGHGLRGMRERLEALGGTLRIVTQEHAGFRLEARLPREVPT